MEVGIVIRIGFIMSPSVALTFLKLKVIDPGAYQENLLRILQSHVSKANIASNQHLNMSRANLASLCGLADLAPKLESLVM
jgi:hypothetical protein